MKNIIENVSTLTTISEDTLAKLNDTLMYCISDAVLENIIEEKDITELNLGFGILKIQHIGNEIKYKFIPSEFLEKVLIDTIKNKRSSLKFVLEETLVQRLSNIYKNLL